MTLRLEIGRPNHPGPGFYPLVCGAALGVFALLIMLQALKMRPTAVRFWKAGANRRRIAAAFSLVATIGIYAVFRFLLRAPLPDGLIERLW